MFSYIKIIKLYLFLILIVFVNLFSTSSISHEIKPSIADFTYDDSYFLYVFELNLDILFLLRIFQILLIFHIQHI